MSMSFYIIVIVLLLVARVMLRITAIRTARRLKVGESKDIFVIRIMSKKTVAITVYRISSTAIESYLTSITQQ